MIKNKHHQELLFKLQKYCSKKANSSPYWGKSYVGSSKKHLGVSNPNKKKILKAWLKKNPDISFIEYLNLLDSLYQGKTHEEVSLAGKLLELTPKLRKQIDPNCLDRWLNNTEGWAEVDSLCQSNFTPEEMFSNWNKWKKLLTKFSTDKNVHKRRASLVLLTKSTRKSSEDLFSFLAFENIEKLKGEKNILITKAVSWLLRDLIKNHRKEVEVYLEKNKNSLPKIAVRETKRKLLTGRK